MERICGGFHGDCAAERNEYSHDSVSFALTLLGEAGRLRQHDFLYLEFSEAGSAQDVRLRQLKGVRRPMLTGRLELFDVLRDTAETYNLARNPPEVVPEIEVAMERARSPHLIWRPR